MRASAGSQRLTSHSGMACVELKDDTMPAKIRKLIVQVDETRIEMGRAVEPPARKALAMAVIENPYAGRRVLRRWR